MFFVLFCLLGFSHALNVTDMFCSSINVARKDVTHFMATHVVRVERDAYVMLICSIVIQNACDLNVDLRFTGLNKNYKEWPLETRKYAEKVTIDDILFWILHKKKTSS